MKKKLRHTADAFYSISLTLLIVVIWQISSNLGLVPSFMLPSPIAVIDAMIRDFPLLLNNAGTTLLEAALGLFLGVLLGFLCATLMNRFKLVYRTLYPLVVLTQTVPTIAIAPLLVLWMGYGIGPKVALIVIVTFFPIAVALYDGFQTVDKDMICLLEVMGASRFKIFRYVTWPASLSSFFAALRISTTYAVVGGVIAEWIGGDKGLGVYMTLARQSYAYDKMFAVIFFISLLSLLLMAVVKVCQQLLMPWEVENDYL